MSIKIIIFFWKNNIKLQFRYTNKIDFYSFGITFIYIETEKYPQFSLKNAVNDVQPKLKEPIVEWVRELILSLLPDGRPYLPKYSKS